MRVERTPFTTYDLIGYFIPGFIALYIFYLTFPINFDCILTLQENNHSEATRSYEYIIFTIFIFTSSWFLGHLLSMFSHIFQKFAEKNYENENSNNLFDLLKIGKRNIFKLEDIKYNNMLEDIYKNFTSTKEREKIPDIKKNLFLKSFSNYKDPQNFHLVYNYMVIQGTFRAFTFIFILHFLVIIFSNCLCIPLDEFFIVNRNYVLFFDIIIISTCWNIYLKYFRRTIEENIILMFYELKDKKKNLYTTFKN